MTWTNHDNFTHSVQLEGDAEPVAVMKPGESASYTFAKPGSFPYICSFHPQDMTGTVEVLAPSTRRHGCRARGARSRFADDWYHPDEALPDWDRALSCCPEGA